MSHRTPRTTLLPPNGKKQKLQDVASEAASILSLGTNATKRGGPSRSPSQARRTSMAPSEAPSTTTTKQRPPEAAQEVVHFVYSEAVEKAIRRGYKTSAYPPLSGPRLRRDNTFLVHSLPDIYSNLVTVRHMRKRNVEKEEEFRKSMPDLYAEMMDDSQLKDNPRLPRLRLKFTATGAMHDMRKQKAGFGARLSSPKLPNLLINRAKQLHSDTG